MNDQWLCEWLSNLLVTYLVHSAFLLGSVLIFFQNTRAEYFDVRELCWRFAMPLGLLTALIGNYVNRSDSLNLAATRWMPTQATGFQSVDQLPAKASTPNTNPLNALEQGRKSFPPKLANSTASSNRPHAWQLETGTVPKSILANSDEASALNISPEVNVDAYKSQNLQGLVCFTWLVSCVWCAVRSIVDVTRMQRLLKSGSENSKLDSLARDIVCRTKLPRRLRIRTLTGITQPFTVGWLAPTIVVPERALTELSREQLRALLAHELGHVANGHSLWLALLTACCRLFCFQPLNFWCLNNWRRDAEFIADRWATGHRIRPQTLASCLVSVADWQLGPRGVLRFIGQRKEVLVERVELLIKESSISYDRSEIKPWCTRGVISGVALLLIIFGPVFSANSQADSIIRSAPQDQWSAIEQEWQLTQADIVALAELAKRVDSPTVKEPLISLLEKLDQFNNRFQEVRRKLEMETMQ